MIAGVGRMQKGLTNGCFRRFLPVVVRPSEGRFTKPTAAVQPWQLELVFMCISLNCNGSVRAPGQAAAR